MYTFLTKEVIGLKEKGKKIAHFTCCFFHFHRSVGKQKNESNKINPN